MAKFSFAVAAAAFSQDPREAVRLARRAGFSGIVLEAQSRALDIIQLSASGRRELSRSLSAQDQKLVAIRFDPGAQGFSVGADVERALRRFEQVLEAAAELKAGCVCSDFGPLPADAQSMSGEFNAALAQLGERCDRYGVMIAIGSSLSSFASLQQALSAAGCPWFGVDLDPLSLLLDQWDMDTVFARLGPLIRQVRARDGVVGADRRIRPVELGKGGTNFAQLLSNLSAAEYRGWIAVEGGSTDRAASAMAELGYLQNLER